MKYSDFIKNKSVIFVGPATTLLNKGTGAFIDSHDVVIRTNGSFPIPRSFHNDYGKKCDSLYTNMYFSRKGNMSVNNYINNGLKFLSLKYDAKKLHERFKNTSLNIRLIDKEFIKYRKHIKAPPLMGTYIINEIVNMNPKSFYITGMSFYSEKNINDHYINEYLPKGSSLKVFNEARIKNHKQSIQNEIVKAFIKSGRVKADQNILKILNLTH